jgi:hypothetical protein
LGEERQTLERIVGKCKVGVNKCLLQGSGDRWRCGAEWKAMVLEESSRPTAVGGGAAVTRGQETTTHGNIVILLTHYRKCLLKNVQSRLVVISVMSANAVKWIVRQIFELQSNLYAWLVTWTLEWTAAVDEVVSSYIEMINIPRFNLTVSTINCNSMNVSTLGKRNAKTYLKIEGITGKKADVILITDMRASNKGEEIKKLMGLTQNGSSRGVGIAIKRNIQHVIIDKYMGHGDENVLLMNVVIKNVTTIGAIYGPNNNYIEFYKNIEKKS